MGRLNIYFRLNIEIFKSPWYTFDVEFGPTEAITGLIYGVSPLYGSPAKRLEKRINEVPIRDAHDKTNVC